MSRRYFSLYSLLFPNCVPARLKSVEPRDRSLPFTLTAEASIISAFDHEHEILSPRRIECYTIPTVAPAAVSSKMESSMRAEGEEIVSVLSHGLDIVPPGQEASIRAVEEILGYRFRDKTLLEEALTHSSYDNSRSYQRLEFVGDAALGLAFCKYVFLAYPRLDQGHLSLLRAANLSTEKLARVAVCHGLYHPVRLNARALQDKVLEFVDAVGKEDDTFVYGGSVKAPKILADIVESVAAAVYVDVNFDVEKLWEIFKSLLEPIVTLEDVQQQPQPVTKLFQLCQKVGMQLVIKYQEEGAKYIASVYVDDMFVAASRSFEQKKIAKRDAAEQALPKLSSSVATDPGMFEFSARHDGSFEIKGAKQRLNEICSKKRWPKPFYRIEEEMGPPHNKKFVCSVHVTTEKGVSILMGDKMSKVREAENSAASHSIHALQQSNYL